MFHYAYAICVDDYPARRDAFVGEVVSAGFGAHASDSPLAAARSLSRLDRRELVLAFIHGDIRTHGPEKAALQAFLTDLATFAPLCLPVVYGSKFVDEPEALALKAANPRTLAYAMDDVSGDTPRLAARRLITGEFGDLVLRHGAVFHPPSRSLLTHTVGVALMLAAQVGQLVGGDATDHRNIRRFHGHLTDLGSEVRVTHSRGADYRLVHLYKPGPDPTPDGGHDNPVAAESSTNAGPVLVAT